MIGIKVNRNCTGFNRFHVFESVVLAFGVEGVVGEFLACHCHASSICQNESVPSLAGGSAVLTLTWHDAGIHEASLDQGLKALMGTHALKARTGVK